MSAAALPQPGLSQPPEADPMSPPVTLLFFYFSFFLCFFLEQEEWSLVPKAVAGGGKRGAR